MNAVRHALTEVFIGDDQRSWVAAGFSVERDVLQLGGVAVHTVGEADGRGVRSLAIGGLTNTLDGIALHRGSRARDVSEPHPNGVVAIDHIVVTTPDCDRTTAALEAVGIEARRLRQFAWHQTTRRQTFFWLGDVILELIGPDTAEGDGPAAIWGLALTCRDLDRTAAFLGSAGGAPKKAIQPGRRILTINTQDLGISAKIAVMSPHGST